MVNHLQFTEKIAEDIYYLDQWDFLAKRQDFFNQIMVIME